MLKSTKLSWSIKSPLFLFLLLHYPIACNRSDYKEYYNIERICVWSFLFQGGVYMSFDFSNILEGLFEDENLIWIILGLFLLLGDSWFDDTNFLWLIALGVLFLIMNGDFDFGDWFDEDNWWWIAFLIFLLFDFEL